MAKRVNILEERTIFERAIFRVKLARLQHELLDGTMSEIIERLSLERGDSVAVVMHNPVDDTLVLTEQFRYPTYARRDESSDGWMLELPAGIVETGENPEATAYREVEEETGYKVVALHEIGSFYLSPGGSSERIFLYYARVNPEQRVSKGGGMPSEHEHIRTLHVKLDDALARLATGEIHDAKTTIALQWLQLNRNNLPS